MKHQEYRNWILARETLTTEQHAELVRHLNECSRCGLFAEADQEIQLLFKEAPVEVPAPGFRQRFEQRLAAKRAKQYQRQVRLTLALSALLALVLGAGVLVGLLMLLLSSDDLVFRIFQDLFQVLKVMVLFGSAGKALLGSVGSFVDPSFGYTVAAVAAGLCLVWFSSLYRIRSYYRNRE